MKGSDTRFRKLWKGDWTYSISTPSTPCWLTRATTAFTKIVLFASLTAVEKYADPVQPPIERTTRTPYNHHHQIWIYSCKSQRSSLHLHVPVQRFGATPLHLLHRYRSQQRHLMGFCKKFQISKLAMEKWKETNAKANVIRLSLL